MKKLLISLTCILGIVSLTACSTTTTTEVSDVETEEVQIMTKSIKVPLELRVEGTTLSDNGIEAIASTDGVVAILEGPIDVVSRITDENLEIYVSLNNEAQLDSEETLTVEVTEIENVKITLQTTEVLVTYAAIEVAE